MRGFRRKGADNHVQGIFAISEGGGDFFTNVFYQKTKGNRSLGEGTKTRDLAWCSLVHVNLGHAIQQIEQPQMKYK